MKKGFKKLTALLLLCTMLASICSFTGCAYGGATTAYNVKEGLIKALNNMDYDDYLSIAYPPLREVIEKEKEEKGMSDSEYMKYIKDSVFPFEEDTLITQSSKIAATDKTYDDTQLQLIADQFIFMDDYIELDSASSSTFLVRDYRQTDDNADAFYEMQIVIVCAEGHYYFSSYSIDKQMYDFNKPTEAPTTEAE